MINPLKLLCKVKLIFDLVSDLHIDQWSPEYRNLYPCGEIKNSPFEFKKTNSNYLIVAGDISDDLHLSVEHLNKISIYYDKILFVDGNHEHVHIMPKLYSKHYINDLINSYNNDKLIYLPCNSYVIEDTVFIGSCGWWDYQNKDEDIVKYNHKYFGKRRGFTRDMAIEFINNVFDKSRKEFEYLKNEIEYYEKNDKIKSIVLVTHSVPKSEFSYKYDKSEYISAGTQYNTLFSQILNKDSGCVKYEKISHWIFGHSHHNHDIYDFERLIRFISNPRGRYEDYNRTSYSVKELEI